MMYFAEKNHAGEVQVWPVRDEKSLTAFMRFHLGRGDADAPISLPDFITAATQRNATFRAYRTGIELAAALRAGEVPDDIAAALAVALSRHEAVAKRPYGALRLGLVLALLALSPAHANDLRADMIGRALTYYASMNGYGRIEAGELMPAPAAVKAHAITCDLIDGQHLSLSFLADDEGADLAAVTRAARDSAGLKFVVATMQTGEGRDAFGVVVVPRACGLYLPDGSPVLVGRK